MGEIRTIKDPFTGQTVEARNDLSKRLRGLYASGPTLPSGEPEFGWQQMGEPKPIEIEAANEIERLRLIEAAAQTLIDSAPMGDDDQLYIAEVMQPKFEDLLRAMPDSPTT